jgi:hypothetical protein
MRSALAPIAARSAATIVEIDVDADPALEARFGDRVPVLIDGDVDGVELCHYRLDAARVMDALGLHA